MTVAVVAVALDFGMFGIRDWRMVEVDMIAERIPLRVTLSCYRFISRWRINASEHGPSRLEDWFDVDFSTGASEFLELL